VDGLKAMSRIRKNSNFPNISLRKLLILTYLTGYILYLIPALIWGWVNGVELFAGFVAWQAFLYAPLWPIVLFAQFYGFIIPLL